MERLSGLYGRLLAGLALAACLLLFLMMLMICADVLLRNVVLIPGMQGLAWSNEVSESMLYLITMLTVPWILRRGRELQGRLHGNQDADHAGMVDARPVAGRLCAARNRGAVPHAAAVRRRARATRRRGLGRIGRPGM